MCHPTQDQLIAHTTEGTSWGRARGPQPWVQTLPGSPGLWGTHQAPVAGSCKSVLALPGSSSVFRRKEGQACTCLSTLLFISSKLDMVSDLRTENTALAHLFIQQHCHTVASSNY